VSGGNGVNVSNLLRRPHEGGCQEILRTDQFVVPAKAGTQCWPWLEQGSKRLKSLGSRFRGNDGYMR
jgi:hypothetical protein